MPTPLIHARRHAAKLDKAAPVVVVGSGITGIAAGALLAEIGHEVHVLESHPSLIGGHARTFEIEGFRFCAGPQYVWDFRDGRIGQRVLEFLGLDRDVPFDLMDRDGFERILVGDGEPVDMPMGLDRLQAAMIERFPGEEGGLGRFFDTVEDLSRATRVLFERALFLKSGAAMKLAALLSRTSSVGEKLAALRYASSGLAGLFDAFGLSPASRVLLYGHGGIFTESAAEVSAILFAAATGYYHQGAAYPRFGFQSLIDGFRSKIEARGGTVECGKRVVRLDVARGRVTRVHSADGTSLPAGHVVSNLAPRLTCQLLDGERGRLFHYAPSNTLISCFVGVSGYPGLAARLARRNLWWYEGLGDVDYTNPDMTARPQMLYIGSPSLNRDAHLEKEATEHSLIVFAPGNFEQASRAYEQSPRKHDELRESMTERMLAALEEKAFPGVRKHIRVVKTLTPLDLHREIACEAGNVYGRRLTAQSLLQGAGRMPRIANLDVACASVGVPGIASGCQTAAVLVERLTGVRV